jgi:hypothetical protein
MRGKGSGSCVSSCKQIEPSRVVPVNCVVIPATLVVSSTSADRATRSRYSAILISITLFSVRRCSAASARIPLFGIRRANQKAVRKRMGRSRWSRIGRHLETVLAGNNRLPKPRGKGFPMTGTKTEKKKAVHELTALRTTDRAKKSAERHRCCRCCRCCRCR